MGSYCAIQFDDMEIVTAKSYVPDDYAALFQEGDRDRSHRSDDEPNGEARATFRYKASRETILRRLSLLGATREVVVESFDRWLKELRETWGDYAKDGWGHDVANAAQQLTPAEWIRRVPEVLATRFAKDDFDREPIDEIDRQLRDDSGEGWLNFDGYGSLYSLRAMLEACVDVQWVTLDMTDLVDAGYYDSESPLALEARRSVFESYNPLTPTLILAEGSTDIAIFRATLPILYPELVDYFSFFNHAELSVDGGAVYLVKFLKAFAAANITNRMIAVFDNDTVGVHSFKQASALALPPNIIVTRLPDCETARHYPTVGPQGRHSMNVNGLAAGIELYLGAEALSLNDELRPVRWTGYVAGADAYQGEVQGKTDVARAFLHGLAMVENREEAVAKFADLVGVWEHLINLVESAAEASSLRAWTRLQREF
ncbi:HEPN/Toprim-associated domain-containing protein [Brevundimonas aurantiaca]|uniref:HEPN/Toprim-associated domain-containing protein n=1 Tax=Brevundimonas aurantiaca TaxID=74316 RepID=UPI001917C8A0|nr:HEPN/Toprim-associated domain-containing protein [Brevundimonas aurantiaca]KAK0342303.1 hypothetical protein LTR94_022764 [Friedmanniomyces endolithicus]